MLHQSVFRTTHKLNNTRNKDEEAYNTKENYAPIRFNKQENRGELNSLSILLISNQLKWRWLFSLEKGGENDKYNHNKEKCIIRQRGRRLVHPYSEGLFHKKGKEKSAKRKETELSQALGLRFCPGN